MNGGEIGLVCDPRAFFGDLVAHEMHRERFQNILIREFLSELCANFLCSTDRFHVFYAPNEAALALELPEAEWGKLEKIGEQLLFGVGFFPESFEPRGKRLVGLPYYIGIEKAIAARLSQWSERWWEVDHAFPPTIKVLNHVRSRVSLSGFRLVKEEEDMDEISPLPFF
jgi:hypothetical protein